MIDFTYFYLSYKVDRRRRNEIIMEDIAGSCISKILALINFNVLPMLSPSLLWLIAGAILCFMETVFPVSFVVFMMGISAMLVAATSLIIASFYLQIIL